MNATTCIIIVLVCWNVVISFYLIEHIMETREYLKEAFKFIDWILGILVEMKNER